MKGDLEKAIEYLKQTNCSLALAKGEEIVEKNGRGISPLIAIIDSDEDFCGFSAADKIIGKAAALLLIKMGITSAYGAVMSKSAISVFSEYGVDYSYGALTDSIMNRAQTDECPMEKTARDVTCPNDAPRILKCALENLRKRA